MSFSKEQAIIQAMLFATGREVSKKEIMNVLEIGEDDIEKIIENMRIMLEEQNSSLEIIKVEDSLSSELLPPSVRWNVSK